MKSKVTNYLFKKGGGEDHAKQLSFIIWYFLKTFFFLTVLPYPSFIKIIILRIFGASVESTVYFKPRINIHIPKNISVGAHSWIGEGVEIINFEHVHIGSNCCISQKVFLCASNHDYHDTCMSYRHAPIKIGDGVWIGACSFIGPGVTIGTDSVVAAGSVVTKDLPEGMICSGNPCIPRKIRWKD